MVEYTFTWIIFNLVILITICFIYIKRAKYLKIKYGFKKDTVLIIGMFIIPFTFFLTYYLSLVVWRYYPKKEFSLSAWHTDPYKRYQLSEDLIERQLLIGMRRNEVEQLLGKVGRENQNNLRWKYFIGRLPGPFSLLPSVVDIEFEGDSVTSVTQYVDPQ